MTSFTSYGRSVSLNFLLATRNFNILQKCTNAAGLLLSVLGEPLKEPHAAHPRIWTNSKPLGKTQPSNYVWAPEDNKINYTQSDLIIQKQPHKESCPHPWLNLVNVPKRWQHLLQDICLWAFADCCFSKSVLHNVRLTSHFFFYPHMTAVTVPPLNHSRFLLQRGQRSTTSAKGEWWHLQSYAQWTHHWWHRW